MARKSQSRPERFETLSGKYYISLCASCTHKRPEGAACKAFPLGIPWAILAGEADHRKPYKGDHGIQDKKRR